MHQSPAGARPGSVCPCKGLSVPAGLELCHSPHWPSSITVTMCCSHSHTQPGVQALVSPGCLGSKPPGAAGGKRCWRGQLGQLSPRTFCSIPASRCQAGTEPTHRRHPPLLGAHLANRCWPKRWLELGTKALTTSSRQGRASTAGSSRIYLLPGWDDPVETSRGRVGGSKPTCLAWIPALAATQWPVHG